MSVGLVVVCEIKTSAVPDVVKIAAGECVVAFVVFS